MSLALHVPSPPRTIFLLRQLAAERGHSRIVARYVASLVCITLWLRVQEIAAAFESAIASDAPIMGDPKPEAGVQLQLTPSQALVACLQRQAFFSHSNSCTDRFVFFCFARPLCCWRFICQCCAMAIMPRMTWLETPWVSAHSVTGRLGAASGQERRCSRESGGPVPPKKQSLIPRT